MVEDVINGYAHDHEKHAVPLGKNLPSGAIGEPTVEVVSQEREEQRESVNQAIGRGIEAAAIKGEDLRQEPIHRVVRQEQAGHEDEDLQEVPQLGRNEQTQERRLLDLARSLGLLELRRLLEVAPDIEREENRDNAGYKRDAPAIGGQCRLADNCRD